MAESAALQYWKTQVSTASPVQLVVIMYEGVARFLSRAASAMEAGNRGDTEFWAKRTTDVVQELLDTLDFSAGGDVASRLGGIYTLTLRETLRAQLKNDPVMLRKLALLYQELKSAWESLARVGKPCT